MKKKGAEKEEAWCSWILSFAIAGSGYPNIF